MPSSYQALPIHYTHQQTFVPPGFTSHAPPHHDPLHTRQTHSIMPATSYPPPLGHYHYSPQPYINLPATSPVTHSSFPCRQATMDTYPTYPYPPPSTIQSSYSISTNTLPSYPQQYPTYHNPLPRLSSLQSPLADSPTSDFTWYNPPS